MKYDFYCPECGNVVEFSMSVDEYKPEIECDECPKCLKKSVYKRIFTAPRIKFVGPGFYCNDYNITRGEIAEARSKSESKLTELNGVK
jgi:predicted nucleic acid-binding Zn ribbon protein